MSASPQLSDERAPETPARRVRVLWLIKGLGPGGAERLLALTAGIRDREAFEHEAAYLLPWKSHLRGDLEAEGIPVHCLEGSDGWRLGWARRLRTLLMSRPFDVLHVHSPYVAAIARLVVRSLPRAKRPRTISTEHVAWSGYARATRIANALTFGLDDAHLAVSGTVGDSVPARHARDLHVVVHGVRPEVVRRELLERDAIRAELGIASDEIVIGTVANLRAQKDYPTLLRAARALLDRGVRARFVAVGQGPLEDQIRALHAELELGDDVMLLGFRENGARVMAACDVFVLSSLFEGLPVALMEAMSLGLPVVGTRVDGIVDAVDDDVEGLLVAPGDPDALADALGRVVADEQLRARLGAASEARAKDFDLVAAVRRTEQIYRDVLAKGRGA